MMIREMQIFPTFWGKYGLVNFGKPLEHSNINSTTALKWSK